jgi:hypothetical protein
LQLLSVYSLCSSLANVSAPFPDHYRRAGGQRAQVRQGPERQPRGAKVHRVRRPTPPSVYHRLLPGTGN